MKYQLLEIEGKKVVLDVAQLLSDEVLYINATKQASQFDKSRQEVARFLKSESFKRYAKAFSNVYKSDDVKLVKKRGGRHGGTYIHSGLAIFFLRWLDDEFAVKCDMLIRNMILHAKEEKARAHGMALANAKNEAWLSTRTDTKAMRQSLTDAIKALTEYAEDARGRPYSFSPFYPIVTNAIYQFLGLKKPAKGINPRDVFSGDEIIQIAHCEILAEEFILGLIENGADYHELGQKLVKYFFERF